MRISLKTTGRSRRALRRGRSGRQLEIPFLGRLWRRFWSGAGESAAFPQGRRLVCWVLAACLAPGAGLVRGQETSELLEWELGRDIICTVFQPRSVSTPTPIPCFSTPVLSVGTSQPLELRGRVVDALTLKPVPAARLWSRADGAREGEECSAALGNAFGSVEPVQGCFSVPAQAPLTRLIVEAPGYACSSVLLSLSPSQFPPEMEVHLKREGRLKGHVQDVKGRAIENAELRLSPLEDFAASRTTRSSADGSFVFQGLDADRPFRLIVRAPGFLDQTLPPFWLAAGEEYSLGNLVVRPAGRLEGVVLDHLGQPVSGAQVAALLQRPEADGSGGAQDAPAPLVLDADQPDPLLALQDVLRAQPTQIPRIDTLERLQESVRRKQTVAGPDGHFRLDALEAGLYRVRALEGEGFPVFLDRIQVHVGKTTEGLVLRLPAPQAPGTPSNSSSSGAHGKRIQPQPDPCKGQFRGVVSDEYGAIPNVGIRIERGLCHSLQAKVGESDPSVWFLADSEGSFLLDNLESGEVTFTIAHPQFTERSITLDLAKVAPTEPLSISLERGYSLRGRLFPAELTTRLIVSDEHGRTALPDDQGRFHFQYLPRGLLVLSVRSRDDWDTALKQVQLDLQFSVEDFEIAVPTSSR